MSHLFSHLHKRATLRQNFPHPNRFVRVFDYAMYGVAILTPLALLPQVFQVFIARNVAGLSVLTWSLLGIVNLLWSLYGFIHKQFPVFIANLLIGILDFIIVFGILLYR